jgi:hypothetical protein
MANAEGQSSSRFDFFIAFFIAIVSLTTALAAWRMNVVGSSASDANRQGLIDAVKKQTFLNTVWTQVYQEADYARNFAMARKEVESLEASGDDVAAALAGNQRQFLLPGLQSPAGVLAADEKYALPDGTFDIARRLEDVAAESPDLNGLDPQVSFKLADQYGGEVRLLTVSTVLMALSLFWLALAEISRNRVRAATVVIGGLIYIVGLGFFLLIEVIFAIMRGVAA